VPSGLAQLDHHGAVGCPQFVGANVEELNIFWMANRYCVLLATWRA